MEYSNKEILVAVFTKWAEPLISTFANANVSKIPMLMSLENKVKSSGWVSPNWSLMQELAPFTRSVSKAVVTPMINKALEGVDDTIIPSLAHQVIDEALTNGSLTILEGKITFSKEDLTQLKNLLNWNLPVTTPLYQVKENGI